MTLNKGSFIAFCFLLIFSGFSKSALAQKERLSGKVIPHFGQTYKVDNPDFVTDLDTPFKVVFDVSSAPEKADVKNKWIETAARFLNMHAEAGKPTSQLDVAMVLHGNASYGLLSNEHYLEKFGVDNPNIELFEALLDAGVQVILCGQTMVHRDLGPNRRIPNIQVALSAMTAMIQLQHKGYILINFN
ncbi:MAG: DsrE family protein [Gilvibacter sp.]